VRVIDCWQALNLSAGGLAIVGFLADIPNVRPESGFVRTGKVATIDRRERVIRCVDGMAYRLGSRGRER
jgi:hypothetical protein